MEEKIIELYDLDQEAAELLRREAEACRISFTIRPSNPLSCEIVGMFARHFKCFFTIGFRSIQNIIRNA